MITASERLVNFEKGADYVPFVSTVTGLAGVYQKYMLLPSMSQKQIKESVYYSYLDKKSFRRCLIVSIPILGNLIVYCLEDKESKPPQESRRGNSGYSGGGGDPYEQTYRAGPPPQFDPSYFPPYSAPSTNQQCYAAPNPFIGYMQCSPDEAPNH